MNHHQVPTDHDGMEFSTSATRRVAILQKENESLRQELAQMRMNLLQQKQQHREDTEKLQQQLREVAGGGSANNSSNNTNNASPSPAKRPPGIITFDTRKNNSSTALSKARRERVKVSFSLMSVKHAMQRLRNSVQEIRTGVDADFIDAAKMIDAKKKSIDDRIAVERPLVHKIHEAICDLAKRGGNQKAETLQHLFSATSWGHTRISLTQAAPDIVKELEALVIVAEQQRRAKEILEVATIHKERSLERANKAVLEMARTARNVVSTFAQMARDVHKMAQSQAQQEEEEDNSSGAAASANSVKSILITRALTLPDLDKFLPATASTKSGAAKSSELSLKQIEKFARHLQDSAFAATTLLQSATQAVLEPESIVVNNVNASASPTKNDNNSNNTDERQDKTKVRRKSIKFEDEVTAEQQQQQNITTNATPSLVKTLRKRWVKSVFERAMLRMRFKNLLSSIHDDFVLNNLVHEAEESSKMSASASSRRKNGNNNTVQESSTLGAVNTTGATKWSSAFVKPTAPVSASATSTTTTTTMKQNNNNNKTDEQQQHWTSEDERRLKIHEKRHRARLMKLLDPQHTTIPDAELSDEVKQQQKKVHELRETVHKRLVDLSQSLDHDGNGDHQAQTQQQHQATYKMAKKQYAPSHFLRPTATTSRRALPPPSGLLGKMSPLTGVVETAEVARRSNNSPTGVHQFESGGWRRGARSDFSTVSNQQQQPKKYNNPHNDVTEGMRVHSPRWFQPMTKTTTSMGKGVTTTTTLNPQPPSTNNSKFANVPTKDTLKEFFVLHEM